MVYGQLIVIVEKGKSCAAERLTSYWNLLLVASRPKAGPPQFAQGIPQLPGIGQEFRDLLEGKDRLAFVR
jgi:hypothetical protein